jgi:hypothetical protein
MNKAVKNNRRRSAAKGRGKKVFPPGWDAERVSRVIEHYERQTDEEAAAEDDAAFMAKDITVMAVPTELVQAVVRLIASRRGA